VTVLATLLAIWFVVSLYAGLPGRDAIGQVGRMAQATEIYDAQDALAFTISTERRIDVGLDEVSPHMINAVLAIEDRRFYEHTGFDPWRIVGAAMANVREGRAAQGASTITQQLARQSFLTPDKTLRRKLQEVILARRIEREFTKLQILEFYLNKVYFGDGLYGVEAAARGYFGKRARELTVAEAATLAGLVKSPSTFAPTVNLARATDRRNLVLGAMKDQGTIDDAAWEAAQKTPLTLTDALRPHEAFGEFFKEQIRRDLVERFGRELVYEGGLRVFSTVDLRAQKAADRAITDGLAAIDARRARPRRAGSSEPAALEAALVALDAETGAVRAMVGGRDFAKSSFNRAVQAHRQPGSAFKPFVFAAALEAGYAPATIIDDLHAPIETVEGAWLPEDGHVEAESLSLRDALRISSNRAAVRLLQDIGIPRAVRAAKAMGVGDVPPVPSLALGSGEVTLQSLTAAYAAFANHGQVPQPYLIRRIETREGQVLFEASPLSTPAVSDQTAFLMSSMLAGVIDGGTGAAARRLGFRLPAAGKTGTTNDFKDAWFVGFTPRIAAGVWVGYDQPRSIGPGEFASDIAVPIWTSFMIGATRGHRAEWFSVPPGVTTAHVCRLSGQRATHGCDGYTEYFASGTEPAASCDLHGSRGLLQTLASVFTNSTPAPPLGQAPPDAPLREPSLREPTRELASEGPTAVAADEPLRPAPRRGFWSRVFGIGRGRDEARER
jgi:penicillin-binding protein 1A